MTDWRLDPDCPLAGCDSGVGPDDIGRQPFDQRLGLRSIALLAGGEREVGPVSRDRARPCGSWCSGHRETG